MQNVKKKNIILFNLRNKIFCYCRKLFARPARREHRFALRLFGVKIVFSADLTRCGYEEGKKLVRYFLSSANEARKRKIRKVETEIQVESQAERKGERDFSR